jgi:hypothetical protein
VARRGGPKQIQMSKIQMIQTTWKAARQKILKRILKKLHKSSAEGEKREGEGKQSRAGINPAPTYEQKC